MADLRITVDADGPDLSIDGGDVGVDLGLETLVLTSLLTNRRAADGDPIPDGDDPRGYWAESPGSRWGSRLWLLSRAKRIPETLARAREYAAESLDWAIVEGIASRVDVEVDWAESDPSALVVAVTLTRPTDRRWSELWEGQDQFPGMAGNYTLRVLVR